MAMQARWSVPTDAGRARQANDRARCRSLWADCGEAAKDVPGMVGGRSLGRQFGWLWAAYAASTFGSWVAFDALPLIAILVLHAGPTEVSLLAATGLAVGAVVAVPLGPWVEFRRKRPA